VHIQNDDNQAYRLRLKETDASKGIDIVIPAGGCVSVMIKKDDEFQYLVMDPDDVRNGIGGGGIKN
jgi:hypothetical protein